MDLKEIAEAYQLVYEKKKHIIKDLLNINNAEEFIEVFDDDQVKMFLIY